MFPPIARARLLTRDGAGRATVDVVPRPQVALPPGSLARVHELHPHWEVDGPVGVGELADAVASLRLELRGVRDRGRVALRQALLEAIEPMESVDLALRMGRMLPYP